MGSHTKFLISAIARVLLLTCALGIYGCTTVGPQAIATGRNVYTEVINRTEDEQILNALVRLRYNETFGLLSVASVTASLRFRAQAATDIGIGDSRNYAGNLVPLSAGVAYEENPTISYVPLSGEEFMRRMLSPISLSEWVLMAGPVKRKGLLLALAVDRINRLRNPLPGDGLPSPEFARFVELYGQLRRADVLDIVQAPATGEMPTYYWNIHDYENAHDSVREFLDLLGIDAKTDGSAIILPVLESVGRSATAIHLQTRSVYDVLQIYGAGIEVPSAHLEAGIVEPLISSELYGRKLVKIRTSETPPNDATVQIRFRDWWFYIDATDTQSKRAFGFLRTFIGVRLADPAAAQRAPVLTVPVN